MTAPSFSYSGNVYTSAAAGSVDFALTSTTGNPIAYLEKAHIHVYKSTNQGSTWTELTRPSQWDFVSGGTVARLVTGIATGDWIKVQRITPSTAAYVTFQSSSLLTADQLNDDTLFNTYLNQERYDQGDQSSAVAAAASASAASATSAATAATATANAASTAAAAATTTANAASASAATALSQSNTAITDSAAALAASANAVTTANTAASNAASAVTTAGTANTNATAAVNTANTAASNASTALSQSTTALSNSATALSTANTASSNASTALTNSSNAVTTANTASTNASNAVTTANTANTNATAALNAVASSLQYVLVANVAAIPSSPANNYAIEVADSTGVESFSPLANRPAGFVGDVGLSVRMQYSTTGPTWNWLNYFPNNAETRYLKLAGGTLTGQLRADDSTSVAAPVIAFDGDTNTGLAHTGADELALVTGGTARLTVDPSGAVAVTNALSVGGQAAVVTNDARLSDTRTPTDGSVTNAKVSASAAIAGSKISPDFGAQNVTTTGTSTAASFIPTSSTVPTNGLYLPSAGSVAISTGGSGRLFINSSGQVGIGGTPSYTLDVSGIIRSNEGTQQGRLIVGSDGNGVFYRDANSLRVWTRDTFPITFWVNDSEKARIDSSGRLGIGTSSVSANLHIAKNTNGNVASIRVSGNDGAGDGGAGLLFADNEAVKWSIFTRRYSSNNRLYISTAENDTNSSKVTIAEGGSVGIGSNSPQALLHCESSSQELIRANSTNASGGYISVQSSGTNVIYIGSAASLSSGAATDATVRAQSNLLFTTGGGVEKARLDTSGRLLVGTSSTSASASAVFQGYGGTPSGPALLHLCTGTATPTAELGYLIFGNSTQKEGASITAWRDGGTWTSGSSHPSRLVFSTTADGASSPTERMRISNTGTVLTYSTDDCISARASQGAGTSYFFYRGMQGASSTTAGGTTSFIVYTNGNVQNTNNSYAGISDLRLKENIVDATSQWADIKALQVRKYNFKEETGQQTHTQIGLIAQEVELVSPGLVSESPDRDEDGNDLGTVTKSVNYSVLYMKAVKALQEAMERIEQLEAEMAEVKAQLS